MKNRLILIGDMHDETTAVRLLISILPRLKAAGYQTIYKELTQTDDEDNEPAELIKLNQIYLNLLELFPDGAIPVNPNPQQQLTIMRYQSSGAINTLVEILALNRGREAWLEENNKLYQLIIDLDMQLVPIDVREPDDFRHPGGHGERTQFMFNCIQEKLKTINGHGVVFVGFSHMINCWELGHYNYGVLHHLDRQQNIEISAYLPWSGKDTETTKEAFDRLAVCSEKTLNTIYQLKIIGKSSLDQAASDIIEDKLKDKIQDDKPVTKVIYNIPKTGDLKQLMYYLTDLGARIIGQDDYFIKVEMASHLLNKNRRKILTLERVRIPKLKEAGMVELTNMQGMTVEQEGEKLLLTFPNFKDRNYRGTINGLIKKHELPAANTLQSVGQFKQNHESGTNQQIFEADKNAFQ